LSIFVPQKEKKGMKNEKSRHEERTGSPRGKARAAAGVSRETGIAAGVVNDLAPGGLFSRKTAKRGENPPPY